MNKPKTPWFVMTADTKNKHAVIELYGVIGGWDVNIQDFMYQLKQQGDLDTIHIKLNTLGGSFYHGLPIFNELKQHKAHVTTDTMGYCMSMGSYVLQAGDKRRAASNSLIMIHSPRIRLDDPSTAKDMRKAADLLDQHEQMILPEYMRAMGKSESEVAQLLETETYYTAKQALAAGLIDEIIDSVDIETARKQLDAQNAWHFAVENFSNPPADFQHLMTTHNAGLLGKILNATVGTPPVSLQTTPEDDEVTPEDIEAVADAVMSKMKIEGHLPDEEKRQLETNHAATLQAKDAEMDQLKQAHSTVLTAKDERIQALEQEVADLKSPEPNTDNQGDDLNTGPEGKESHFS